MKLLAKLLTKTAQEIEEVNNQLRASQEEERKVAEAMQIKLRYIDETMSKIRLLDKFPGNLMDYSSLKGCNYEIIDTGEPIKSVSLDTLLDNEVPLQDKLNFVDYLNNILSKGAEGFIYYTEILRWSKERWNSYDRHHTIRFMETRGVPVRRKSLEIIK